MARTSLAKEIASYENHLATLKECEAEHDRTNPRHVAEVATYPAQRARIAKAIAALNAGKDSRVVAVWFHSQQF